MLDITRSSLRSKLLAFYFTNPGTRLHLRELAEKLDENAGNLSRELKRLTDEGLFRAEKIGRQKYFHLNEEYGLYREIKAIVSKTVGLPIQLKRIFEKEKKILFAFIYGSYASGSASMDSDIDIMLLLDGSEFDENRIQREIVSLERTLGREINWSYFPIEEWIAKSQKDDSFVGNLLKEPVIMIKGDERELRRLGPKRQA